MKLSLSIRGWIVSAVALVVAVSGAAYYACTRKCDVREEPRPISPIPQAVSAAPRVKPSPLTPARLTDSARVTDDVSGAVRVIIGAAPDSAADFERRHRALGRLANKKRLSPLDEQRLIDYVASHEDMLAESRAAALRNDVLNVLRLAGADRAELVSMLATMIQSADYPDVLIDYAVQHLGALLDELPEDEVYTCAREALEGALHAHTRAYAGTALLALSADTHSIDEAHLRREGAILAYDDTANPLARMSALALAGEKRWPEVLSAARKIAENEREHYALAISALGVLGSLGDETDWARLNRLKPNLPQAMKKALSVAQDKLRARFQ